MRKEVLEELIRKWLNESRTPECQDGSKEAEVGNARDEGKRYGINKCISDLEKLIELLG